MIILKYSNDKKINTKKLYNDNNKYKIAIQLKSKIIYFKI